MPPVVQRSADVQLPPQKFPEPHPHGPIHKPCSAPIPARTASHHSHFSRNLPPATRVIPGGSVYYAHSFGPPDAQGRAPSKPPTSDLQMLAPAVDYHASPHLRMPRAGNISVPALSPSRPHTCHPHLLLFYLPPSPGRKAFFPSTRLPLQVE